MRAKIFQAYRGMLATAMGIVKEEGFLKLFQGLSPALYRHLVYSGVRIGTFDYMRKRFVQDSGSMTLWKSAVAGVSAGALAQFLASPADLVKVQIQMEGRRRLMGEPPRVLSASHAFREIVKRGGLAGLWKGSIPNVQRAALVNLGDLTTYDSKVFQMFQCWSFISSFIFECRCQAIYPDNDRSTRRSCCAHRFFNMCWIGCCSAR
jgi:solute carrier family 25 uncoupling protein 27